MAHVCVLLAEGFEEIEAVTIIDVLRRAGVEVTTLGVRGREVEGAHGLTLLADAILGPGAERDWDAVILPGGMPGAATLRDHVGVQRLIRRQASREGLLAAICAAPIALGAAGVLEGLPATCYPGFEGGLGGAVHEASPVVDAGRVITSRGPGTALAFALTLVGRLVGAPAADKLRKGMLVA